MVSNFRMQEAVVAGEGNCASSIHCLRESGELFQVGILGAQIAEAFLVAFDAVGYGCSAAVAAQHEVDAWKALLDLSQAQPESLAVVGVEQGGPGPQDA